MTDDHLRQIYVNGGSTDARGSHLSLLCARCGGHEIVTAGTSVAAVVAASTAHVEFSGRRDADMEIS